MTTQHRFMGGLLSFAASATEADWERHYADELPRVYNFFRYRVGDDSMAEDLTSTTFEKAWRGRARYRRDLAAFSTWLFSIARHVAIDYYRQRRVETPLDELQLQADELTTEYAVEQHDDIAQLSRLVSGLPDRERDLLALKYGAGLTNRDIARISSLSESNVGTILHRVVHGLRAEWQD
jgi:RNA polymerase sigma-70 factor, ECF subfamily